MGAGEIIITKEITKAELIFVRTSYLTVRLVTGGDTTSKKYTLTADELLAILEDYEKGKVKP
jgi:hypothetical protein